ncbi:hypothetical protein D046_6190B, partial [Vibrio parahaemolyticus V-223/04]
LSTLPIRWKASSCP